MHMFWILDPSRGQHLCTCFRVPGVSGKLRRYPAMKPYPVLSPQDQPRALLLLCLLGALLVTGLPRPLAWAFSPSSIPATVYHAEQDPQVKVALDDFYNLEYEKAISEFQRIEKAHPDDPFAVVHVLQATVFRELYRLNLLDTTLYAHDGFLSSGKAVSGDPAIRAQVDQLTAKAVKLCDGRMAKNPNDVEALYVRGVARGLKSTYVALVDRSFVAALRSALAARRDHERVLQIDPTYTDAKTVVGAHNYVVGSLPMPVKVLAGIAGLSGSRKRGLEYLQDASREGRDSSVDARIALALFLRREGHYDAANGVVESLKKQYPRNFLFALEHCNLLKDGGKA